MTRSIRKKKDLTPNESRRIRALQEQLDKEKDMIVAEGRALLDAHAAMMESVLADLRAVRAHRQLSLNDLQAATGIDRAQLSRLFSESTVNQNPTILTLQRVAAALGKKVVLSVRDVLAER